MYKERLKGLARSYATVAKNNKIYTHVAEEVKNLETRAEMLLAFSKDMPLLKEVILSCEKDWREGLLAKLELEMMQALLFVFPLDQYQVKLTPLTLRGKIHIDATIVSSATNSSSFPGSIDGTQGRLFQQIISLSAIVGIASLIGIDTVYVDETFSGTSPRNWANTAKILKYYADRGFNFICIAQYDPQSVLSVNNTLTLSRDINNCTHIKMEDKYD